MPDIPPKIHIANFSLRFGQRRLFENFSLTVHTGEKVLLAGPSGCGKSSILASVAGFLQPDEGTIRVDGEVLTPATVWTIRRRLAYVPQTIDFGDRTVQAWVDEALAFRNNSGAPSIEGLVEELSALGLRNDILARRSSDMSGGERQRVALALGLFLKRPLLLVDEPSSALDAAAARALFQRLERVSGMTMLLVSHEHPERLTCVDRMVKVGEIE
ncbi:MAG: ATP-binding cassette domain-containing protein [Lentisphaeria bacterium]|nr:ATP-binding cassette domain-containing protein [Lentisphaeria bacterium]